VEAGFERRANEAAPDLAEFYRGINATNEHGSDVHLSAFGHSYGSVATAQALNELGATGVVDDAAFYGSPGLGHSDMTETHVGPRGIPVEVLTPIRDESDLFLADGHAFVMSAPGDPVSGDISLADVGALGPKPTTLPLEQLSSDAVTTADGTVRQGASGHADYPRMGDDGRTLRTTGYNLAIIAGNLAYDPKYPDLLER
jgi:hypothetical protein